MKLDSVDLKTFLDNKTLYYDKIDYQIISLSWAILKEYINLPYVIHIVGTNGKGSTGRYIASFLNQLNHKVLHYTSPHILKFNERIWIDGKDSSDEQLESGHKRLQSILPLDILNKLTYFEYSTLLALYLSDKFDYIVLEAGLGGEFDATNVVINDLTVVPSIGLDHIEFLGDSIEKIATTKLKSCDNRYIINSELPEVLKLKDTILKDKEEIKIDDFSVNGFKSYLLEEKQLPLYLQKNLSLALRVVYYLLPDFNIKLLKLARLNGRYEKVDDNIIIDVGHNLLAAEVIYSEMKDKRIVLVYNSYKDKQFKQILEIFKPITKEVQIIECNDTRMVSKDVLYKCCNDLDIKVIDFNILNIKKEETYLVFGSFKVVEEFLLLKNKSK
jgi:dihydrofolate synthase/folylpolyglutamate synthase